MRMSRETIRARGIRREGTSRNRSRAPRTTNRTEILSVALWTSLRKLIGIDKRAHLITRRSVAITRLSSSYRFCVSAIVLIV
jgi:hypothetical protein